MKVQVQNLIDQARSHVGNRSRAQKINPYGAAVGQDGQAWAGSFLEVVFRESGEKGQPNLVSTTAALGEFTRSNRIFRVPKAGDLVFYNFSTDHAFAQLHIGLVTDVSKWKKTGAFRVVEGQTASGLPKGPQESDGVYERTRYGTDVLAFARPKYGKTLTVSVPDTGPFVQPANVQPGKRGKSVVLLQSALNDAVGAVGMLRGTFDAPTVSAVARFQRYIGYTGERANGQPDETTLRRLALETKYKYFRVRADG